MTRKRRIRCPYCNGLDTLRYGSFSIKQTTLRGKCKRRRRWYCNSCGKAFTPYKTKGHRCPDRIAFKAARLYFNVKGSLQEVATELSISKRLVLKILLKLGKNCKSSLEIAKELNLIWSGWLGIDATSIKILGVEFFLLLAIDLKSRDIIHFRLAKHEDYQTVKGFLQAIRDEIDYPILGIVSDLGLGRSHVNLQVVRKVFPGIPHQICVVHLERDINLILPRTKRTPLQKELKRLVRKVLYAPREELAIQAYRELIRFRDDSYFLDKKVNKVVNIIRRNFLFTLTHFHYSELPRDNNIVENVVGQIKERLDLLRGFKRLPNAFYLTKLFVVWYRFKKFNSSGIKEYNGHSPLILAGAKHLENIDWTKWCQRTKYQQ